MDCRLTGSDVGDTGSGLTRDRRSKSSAFMHPRKIQSSSATSTPISRSVKDTDDDGQMIGRSPLAWIQRFEEWHKDMKTQKEKKKAEKRYRRNQRSESMFPGTRNGQAEGITWLRGAIDSSPLPLCPQPQASQTFAVEGFSLGNRRRSNEQQRTPTDNVPMLEEPALSRSYSDPFRSPAGVIGQHQRQSTLEKTREQVDRGPMLPQHPFKRDYEGAPQKSDFDDARKLARSGSVRGSRGFSDQSTLSRSTNSYANTASFTQDHQDDTCSNPSIDEKNAKQESEVISPPPLHLETPAAHELLYSPVHCRSSSMDFTADEAGACAPPPIRRIVSVPAEETYAQQKRLPNPKRSNDCSQAMRERANVLQYMHRKASDASSIAGSISRSPRERVEAARMSESSSDSSRFGDHTSNRSGKSKPFRKSSFSFFDKLSSDLENSTHGLDSLVDENEFKTESIGRGSMSSVATGRSSTVDEQRPMGGAIFISSRVDDDTRNEVRNARLDALEADNFGEDADEGDGTHDGDEAYVDEEEGAATATSGRETVRKKRRVIVQGKKKWKVKSLAQLVFEELGNGENAEGPNYLTAAAGPPTHPPRRFCCVCGFFANYNCRRCGSRYCSVGCGDQHKESGCMKFGL
ncbi:unnamed protein product [Phytophthora lilii]|uniref:Unnamed protein product n=1 Tax=Phytophthora lilii TaxID=2077276 RepID=A0A9W6WSX7_9STRA|nr:unnamed protein product [Phytophthora lilii]